jgi:putative ABC transport system permease protein
VIPGESVIVALGALRVNKLRSTLTMLGVIIGVAEVIILVAMVYGARDRIGDQVERLGSNLLVIGPGSSTAAGASQGRGSALTITEEDAAALMRETRSIQAAAPIIAGSAQVVNGNVNWATAVRGTTPEYLETRDWAVVAGRPIGERDVEGVARVVLLGRTVAHQLFGDADPVGQDIRVGSVPFTVIGLLETKGQTSWGQDLDDVVVVPITSAKHRLGVIGVQPRAVHAILVKIKDGASLGRAERELTDVLRRRHRLGSAQADDFSIQNFVEILQTVDATTGALTLLLVAVAVISLAVGGIGIMNIMLVSVTERTREIGVRMAVGARRRDILFQFLAEAVTLALVGGGLGVAVGVGVAYAIAYVADWRAYVNETIDRLAELSLRGFAFNCLTSYADADRMRPDLFYADPCELFDRCKRRYARNVALMHDYDLYEFTILVRKKD